MRWWCVVVLSAASGALGCGDEGGAGQQQAAPSYAGRVVVHDGRCEAVEGSQGRFVLEVSITSEADAPLVCVASGGTACAGAPSRLLGEWRGELVCARVADQLEDALCFLGPDREVVLFASPARQWEAARAEGYYNACAAAGL